MEAHYLSYLALLDELGDHLDRLSELARQKAAAVRQDDLAALNEVLKQEQAISLSLRGLEQKRLALFSQLGLDGVPLSGLADHCPPALKARAKESAEGLLQRYQIYHSASEVARNTLECNLHEIEKVISDLGGNPAEGVGYTLPGVEPPQAMKTDFRA